MAQRPQLDATHDRIQAAGKQLLIYIFSLMKTGEVHELNNEAWYRPTEKLLENLDALMKMERQAITFVIHEGVAQVNSHALWLDSNTTEQANELEQWLARREAGGIRFSDKPPEEQIKRFFNMFARWRAPEGTENQMGALADAMLKEGVSKLQLAPAPLRLEGIGQGVRGVAALWYYAKCSAGMGLVLEKPPIDVKSARRVSQELVDACGTEQDLMCALPLLGREAITPARRAVDVGIYCASVGRGLGLSTVQCADLATDGLLHGSGYAYGNPDPTAFTVPEVVGTLAVKQLVEGSKFGADLAVRICAAVESAIGPEKKGPPYIPGAPELLPQSQLIALATTYLDRVQGVKGRRESPVHVALDLLENPPAHVDPTLAKVFVATVGLLPVGVVVELHNGDIGVVADVDHLRGRHVYRKVPAPVTGPRKVFVERMRDASGKVVPERKARVQLDTPDEQGNNWEVKRTLEPDAMRDLVVRALLRRPSTVIAQLGLRARTQG